MKDAFDLSVKYLKVKISNIFLLCLKIKIMSNLTLKILLHIYKFYYKEVLYFSL
jgi:hypothetical protein